MISGLEIECKFSGNNKKLHLCIVGDPNTNCGNNIGTVIDKYIIQLLEFNNNYIYASKTMDKYDIDFQKPYVNYNNVNSYDEKMIVLYLLVKNDEKYKNKNIMAITKPVRYVYTRNFSIDNYVNENKIHIGNELKQDVQDFLKIKTELTNINNMPYSYLFESTGNKKFDEFAKKMKNMCINTVINHIKQTQELVDINDKYFSLEKSHISFVKGAEFGNIITYNYDILAGEKLSKNFCDLLRARNSGIETLFTMLHTVETLKNIIFEKKETILVATYSQLGFNLIYLLVNEFDFNIDYISDGYDNKKIQKEIKSKSRNDIYDIFTKHPKLINCTNVKI